MKNCTSIISAALICALTQTAYAANDTHEKVAEDKTAASVCTWKDLSISEMEKLKAKNSFNQSKIVTTIEVPAKETSRFVMSEPHIIRHEAESDEDSKSEKASPESFNELKDNSTKVGVRISFCATEAEPDFESFSKAHQSESKVKYPLEMEALLDKEHARAGFSDGTSINLSKPEVLSAALIKVKKLENETCTDCSVKEGKAAQAVEELASVGTQKAKDLIFEIAKADLETLNDKVLEGKASFSSLRSEISKKEKFISGLKIKSDDKDSLYEVISDMRKSLYEQAMKEAVESGKEDASKYAEELRLIAQDQSKQPGISKEARKEYSEISKSFKKNGEGTLELQKAAEQYVLSKEAQSGEKSLVKKVQLMCKQQNIYTSSCLNAQQQLYSFQIKNMDYLPKFKEQYELSVAKQQASSQNPFVQQAIQQSGAAIPLKQAQGPDFFANYKSDAKTADGKALFNETPSVTIPSANFGYDVNHIYQNQSVQNQAASPDYLSVLMSAQKRS